MIIWELLEHYWFFCFFLLIVAFAAYLGLFSTVEAKEGRFPGGLYFYRDLQVSTKNLGPIFREINEHISTY